jgi:hypothetical protein
MSDRMNRLDRNVLIASYRYRSRSSIRDPRAGGPDAAGVEVHPHRGKPWCAPRTRTDVARHSQRLNFSHVLECLFERLLSYTSRPTVRQVNVRRRSRKLSTTRRGAPEAPGSLAQARHVLQASGIALRRTEEERAEAFFPLRATTTAADSKRDARAGHKRTAL